VPLRKKAEALRHQSPRIIVVNRFYWPDQSATAQMLTDLAEHLARQGNEVVAIASRQRLDGTKVILSRRTEHNGVHIHRISTILSSKNTLASKMLSFISFYVSAVATLFLLLKPGDIVIAKSDPPMLAIIPWLLSRFRRTKVINWCQDLYPEVAAALGIRWAAGPIGRTLSAVRNRALKHADTNVVISPSMQNHLTEEGIDPTKIHLIHNWCDKRISPVAKDKDTLRQHWHLGDQFVIAYSGNLGRAHLAGHINTLVESLAEQSQLKMLFIGGGPGMVWLKAQCKRHGHSHVLFKPYQPREELGPILSVADVHLISLHPDCHSLISPSKYYGILAAGRPIAYIGDPDADLAREIGKAKLGLVLNIHHQDRWKEQITQIRQDVIHRHQLGLNARNLYERHYETALALNKWQHLIEHHQGVIDPAPSWKQAA